MTASALNLPAETVNHPRRRDERDKWLRMALPFALGVIASVFTTGRVSQDISNHLADHDRQLTEVRQIVTRQNDDQRQLQIDVSRVVQKLDDIKEMLRK
jgi:hypothetical protein